MGESWRTRLARLAFNVYPSYWGTGGRVTHVEADWSEIRVKLPHSWRTRNPMGATFGGSIYGAVDPLYVVALGKRLGDGYEVWDKSASIRYRQPARETLYATAELPDDEVQAVQDALETEDSVERTYTVDLVDGDGEVHATVENVVHVSRA
jgi:acyl-coenzyme A thioesterase PaaI-like protein